MSPPEPQNHDLPPYRALFAVDVFDFSGFQGRDHAAVTRRIPEVLEAAFERCGLISAWRSQKWHRMIGDSYVAAFRPRHLPSLLCPLLPALQVVLADENHTARIGGRPMRMRVSLHVGPVTDPVGDEITDGSGDPRIATHRLLEAEEVKALLNRSGDGTCVAAIVSERVFADVVAGGYGNDDVDYYRSVSIAVKKYRSSAYLRVPNPTGELLDHGFLPPAGDSPVDGATQPPPIDSPGKTHQGDVTQVGTNSGTWDDSRNVGIGSVGGNVGTVVSGTRGPVHVGDQTDRRNRPRKPRRDG